MVILKSEELENLQKDASNIRNICILAHVDHGKTTLADFLISSNGIISTALAGKMKFMDNTSYEQEHLITCKASCIALHYLSNSNIKKQHLINLIDSPGHVDFSFEVSTATRLSDGALVLVDVTEGVRTQTRTVLRQAFQENLSTCLVLNKIDRLILEFQMTPLDAYKKILKVIEDVNAIICGLRTATIISEADRDFEENNNVENNTQNNNNNNNNEGDIVTSKRNLLANKKFSHSGNSNILEGTSMNNKVVDQDDNDNYYAPEKGNVAFASAIDGWAFRLNDFAEFLSNKLKMPKDLLQKSLWGDHYFNAKTKAIQTDPWKSDQNPMCIQLIFDNIWEIYRQIMDGDNKLRLDQILKGLNIKIKESLLKKGDKRQLIQSVMSQWFPLAPSILQMVVDVLPSPLKSQPQRVLKWVPELKNIKMATSSNKANVEIRDTIKNVWRKLKRSLYQCDSSEEAEVFVCCAKILEVDEDYTIVQQKSHERKEFQPGMKQLCETSNNNENNKVIDLGEGSIGPESKGVSSEKKPQIELSTNLPKLNNVAAEGILSSSTLPIVNNNNNNNNNNCYFNNDDCVNNSSSKQNLIALCRIYSGTIRLGQKLHILGPRYNCLDSQKNRVEFEVQQLFMMMGRSVQPVSFVSAGNVFGIGGISAYIQKSATITSNIYTPICASLHLHTAPIVQVTVEPKNLSDLPLLISGLKLLNHADPSVDVFINEQGEHVVMATGEVHLDRCIRDLTDNFCKIPLEISKPILSFRETIIPSDENSTAIGTTANKLVSCKIRAVSLPLNISNFIENNQENLRKMDITNEFLEELKVQFQNCEDWIDEWPNLWSLGPKGTGPNILVNHVHSLSSNFKSLSKSISSTRIDSKSFDSNTVRTNSSLSSILTVTSATTRIADGNMISNNQNVGTLASEMNKSTATAATATAVAVSGFEEENKSELSYLETMLEKYDKSIVSGFQVATSSGTLCNEPMMAVCFYLEDIDFKNGADSLESDRTFGPLSGQIISMVKDTCLESFDKSSRRLMEAMLKCEVVVGQQCIGKVYPILYKRRAVILKEDYEIGMDLFTISCLLPAVESFGFTSELRTKTSGLAQPFLLFSNWQLLDIDPYALPTTKEEIEEFGVYGEKKPNIAKQYIDSVRRRKGLLIKEKLVEFAEKQRTLSKKK